MATRILRVSDERIGAGPALDAALAPRGFTPVGARSAEEALALLAQEAFDALVVDLDTPGLDGVDLCGRAAAAHPQVPAVVLAEPAHRDAAVAAIRAGAWDFLLRPLDVEALAGLLQRAARTLLREGPRRASLPTPAPRAPPAATSTDAVEVLGDSPALREAYALIDRVADSDASVLILGESGTGKEAAAQALHERSRRREGPFVAINCAAMPEALLESELFGHARGAFTDAKSARTGLFVQASGGTLFLDEIGELPLTLQPKLLRALQSRRVRPVGGDAEVAFDARVVAATNQDLESAVNEGRFREDLYFRIHVIGIELPPLRARGQDVLLLARRFTEDFAQRSGKPVRALAPAVEARLLDYPWPGNVRELQNCIERAVALTAGDVVQLEDLPARIRDHRRARSGRELVDLTELVPLEEVERRHILRVLEAVGGSRTLAARTLGLDRKTLYRKLERYGAGD
ncbi:sigma-54-dependent Fis family transcriptional regulator [Aggregicoccus sp. 17bor-14]|uniref:sigma-54-dependent transcriptional regulator n=1 Tax=Myxococcaceae TaxID=31 RepID=UPI00129CD5D8|nr:MULTISPECIES: sigma-54 dependent transcriptional regulator [Myxococcaceae]MBF5041789.1 sigma-54-dependent Fis family transcriptional regulator [Simulacricoccus sp. 17bor-14]MRI87570.1 sigma-54-dependent Fis family transcriptional regulator [Aggregicoccus sp. 17bor-14]